MEIPVSIDLIQEYGEILTEPEIRVWCHPHYINKSGDDYYMVFDTFKDALKFIGKHKEAENVPLVAFRGYEINLFAIDELKKD